MGESSNPLYDTLADWEAQLRHANASFEEPCRNGSAEPNGSCLDEFHAAARGEPSILGADAVEDRRSK